MPHYLERVVLAGARASTPAKPPAAAPPRMPGVRQPWVPAVETGETIDNSESIDSSESIAIEQQPSVRSSRLSTAAPSAMFADAAPSEPAPEALVPEARESQPIPTVPFIAAEGRTTSTAPMPQDPPPLPADPVPSGAVPIIRAPAALRPMVHNLQNDLPQEMIAARSPTQTESQPSSTPAPPMLVASAPERQHPEMETQPSPGEAAVAPSVQAPKVRPPAPAVVDLRAAPPTMVTTSLTAQVEHKRTSPVPLLEPAAALPPDTWVEASVDPVPPRQVGVDWRSSADVEQQHTLSAPSLKSLEVAHLDAWPLPAPQASATSLSISGNGRQSRITIGRIDVQVNNLPPAPPNDPPPPGTSPIAADILEGRFLRRFALKL